MKRGNKKGLSTIIATLLIILLVLVATGIVWTVVKGVINKNSELVTLGKFTLDLEIVSVTQNEEGTNVKVRRNPGEGEISGLVFSIIDNNGEGYTFPMPGETIDQLEVKVFVLDYDGTIASISVAPIFLTESGKEITGDIGDTYRTPDYSSGGSGSGDDGTCTPDCINDQGYEIICGPSENGCGECAGCQTNYHCFEGACVRDCLLSDCGTRECGFPPARPECGENFCGTCDVLTGEVCNELTWTCDSCVPNCGTMNCGLDPICHSSCGECNEQEGEVCNSSNMCEVFVEPIENAGYVNSYWPRPDGRMLFDSNDLPTEPTVDFYGYYVRFPENPNMEHQCLMIYDFVTPIDPLTYDMSYVKVSEDPTLIEDGDRYEIYHSLQGCCQGSYC